MKSGREMISRSQPHDTSGRALPLGNKFKESFKLTKESFPDDHTQGGEEGGNRNPNRDVAEDFLNLGGSLCAGESADLHATDAEEVDVSVFVDGVALVVGVLSAATSGSLGEVVAHRQLRCGGTGDGDADFVAGGEAQRFQRLCLNRLSGVEVLEIENFLSRVARSQTYSCKQEYDELFFHCL